ncbi:hypothetical protein TVAG_409640 [Trichomonas vaginalis G3]|uniref:Metallo-beta-lactamase domain-containing protein n=1 Tax=Trichomonas vaginalis (strain ATCC PRA-98 / G3) TaxID=412133 RepID=A2F8C4_TRIV3|nr:beta-lactamase superfamily domain-containing protein [Trichomonas vaginalis G3]EAX98826.1 hypothetical protein TVAG_409640 [Trichomonas vaginalis G3]KAI5532252.1 beta-lactamase superfamily domain-containing protein [Trichomonas vaginalis G3]|eukprot:XP_001311756.1 hypothetical protein [Trichomonas vaginalis G3]
MKFQQIRHACVIITFAGKRILVDPWLEPKDTFPGLPFAADPNQRSPIHELPMPVEEIVKVDALIVTHMHFDHFTEYSANLIPKSIPVFSQDEEEAEQIRKWGFNDVRLFTENGTKYEDITITRTDCDHGPDEFFNAIQLKKKASGFVLKSPKEEKTFYSSGDTLYVDCVKDALKKFNPDVVVVNACHGKTPYGYILMGLEEVEQLHNDIPHAKIIASHLDEITHSTVFRSDTRKFVAEHHLEDVISIPNDGETLEY